MTSRTPIYYTRCPVPTASGVAFQTGMFTDAFRGSEYVVPNITELGPKHQDVHYTHSIDMFIREGGVAPPVWARANGVDSVVLGITFMEEFQGVFVRTDDPAETIADLVGRRLALPLWPRLVFNFWRFAALKGLISALAVHNVTPDAVQFIDIVECWDPSERRNVGRDDLNAPARCEYRGQLEALLSGEVDAIFGKGPEVGLLQREAEGGLRLLYDVRSAPGIEERINNSTPRIITTSRRAVEEHFDAVVLYTQTAIRAANWVQDNPAEARSLIARECSIDADDIETYLEPNYRDKFLPRLDEGLVDAVEFVKAFLQDHGFIDQDFAIDEWIDPRPLQQAYEREGLTPVPSNLRKVPMTGSEQDEKVQSLHDAYKGGDPNVTAGVYDNWAEEYETHMKGVGYTHPAMTAALYTRHQPAGEMPMLDAGAGTGIMAEILPALGYPVIDGFDISPGMLARAEKKKLYRNLKHGVLGERLDYADDSYAGVTASGVFTEGHAPLDGLDELVRVVKPGGHIVFSVARIYLGDQIETKATALEDAGKWRRVGTSGLYNSTPLNDKAIMAQIHAFAVL